MKLTYEQLNAANHNKGPALVLAVPGSGKTTVLLSRIEILKSKGIDPNRILTITFSRNQAISMKKRFELLNNYSSNFSTIHSHSYRVLRDYASSRGLRYRLLEGENNLKYKILSDIFFSINGQRPTEEILDELTRSIGYIKNMGITDFELIRKKIISPKNFSKIFLTYENFKLEKRFIDFDDMVSKSIEALKEDSKLRSKFKNKYDYIQLDEGQDTSKLQFEFIDLLLKRDKNLLVVADDDQTIYSFRGTDIKNLLNLKRRYRELKYYTLSTNFRSTKNIIDISYKFISQNKSRFEKDMVASKPMTDSIDIVSARNEKVQCEYIIKALKTSNAKTKAVLFRNNISALLLIELFDRNSIEFNIRDTKKNLYNHFILRDILKIVRFSENMEDIESFKDIYYKLNGYISKEQIAFAQKQQGNVLENILQYPNLVDYAKKNISNLLKNFRALKKQDMKNIIMTISGDMGYEKYLKDNSSRLSGSYYSFRKYIECLLVISSNHKDMESFLKRLKEIDMIIKTSHPLSKDITLSTIHGAKGLEFDEVFLMDLVEGALPTYNSMDTLNSYESQMEEERRIFYVGMTRAKKKLHLLYPRYSSGSKNEKSQFLSDLEKINL